VRSHRRASWSHGGSWPNLLPKRRHLNETQRAIIAAEAAKFPHGINQHTMEEVSSETSRKLTKDQAASLMNVSNFEICLARGSLGRDLSGGRFSGAGRQHPRSICRLTVGMAPLPQLGQAPAIGLQGGRRGHRCG
jgi:hypothetical protein